MEKFNENIDNLMRQVHTCIQSSLKEFWPVKIEGTKFPSESIIAAELIRQLSKVDSTYFYPECIINNQSRDLLIISFELNSIIQIEVKHLYGYDRILNDLRRISLGQDLREYIESINGKQFSQRFDYWGLFIGFGQNNDFNWWIAPTGSENKKKAIQYFNGNFPEDQMQEMQEMHDRDNSVWNQIAKNEKDDKDIWLCYYLTQC
jgi:hypothetical protein